jgi:hypothetical protein
VKHVVKHRGNVLLFGIALNEPLYEKYGILRLTGHQSISGVEFSRNAVSGTKPAVKRWRRVDQPLQQLNRFKDDESRLSEDISLGTSLSEDIEFLGQDEKEELLEESQSHLRRKRYSSSLKIPLIISISMVTCGFMFLAAKWTLINFPSQPETGSSSNALPTSHIPADSSDNDNGSRW